MEKFFKVGQTVYHPVYGKGEVISEDYRPSYPIYVAFENIRISFTFNGREEVNEPISLSQNFIPEIVNKPLTNQYVPFTFEDRELLRGKWIKHKKDYNFEKLIISISEKGVVILFEFLDKGTIIIPYKELLNNFEFIDGSPCGKLT